MGKETGDFPKEMITDYLQKIEYLMSGGIPDELRIDDMADDILEIR